MQTVQKLIDKLDLQPHPEGGYFKETYRSPVKINSEALGKNYDGNRNVSTCIYFMLTSETFSAFHKINQDEIWHFYTGSPISLHIISEEGEHSEILIGCEMDKNQVPQAVVNGGSYFAAKVTEANSYALVGCTVAPGFDFKDFYLPSQEELTAKFPKHKRLIEQFTRS